MKKIDFKTLDEASAYQKENYPKDHLRQIQYKYEYNEQDAKDKARRIEKLADEFHVIDGKIYYTCTADVNFKIINKVDLLGGCLHNGPFYRVCLPDETSPWVEEGEVFLREDTRCEEKKVQGFQRSQYHRNLYAKWGWTMTTNESLYWAQNEEWKKAN